MLARSRGVPMLIGIEQADLRGHTEALIDADNAILVVSPGGKLTVDFASRQHRAGIARDEAERYANAPAVTATGERVRLLINVADGSELDQVDPACCDGIGLVRTEFMNPLPGMTCNHLALPLGSTYGSAARCVLALYPVRR